ncbi:hypothetical protein EVJ32_04925 [Exiguobacterium sp. SH5S4]|uniref:hypothetical protein n=1 Tax=Exiguobacterium sp. SH5S4 TaxID=2510961 RepID=UPI00103B15C2|nr:hypothetical protein [Exiguobacterium sp. SH5S4]TCI26720.1 hypothetical protein EVJ32_04925 [Exiguobacterium sp. SH5S4]
MNFELIETLPTARIYKFDELLCSSVTGKELDNPTNYVLVSDAKTHIERLVFPVYLQDGFSEDDILNKTPNALRVDYFQIAGKMTLMIEGGDPGSILPDEDYLNQLVFANR